VSATLVARQPPDGQEDGSLRNLHHKEYNILLV
jgi:hypothetical protein